MIISRSSILLHLATIAICGCGKSETPSSIDGGAEVSSQRDDGLQAKIDSIAAKLQGDAKQRYESAVQAEPFPQQADLVVGKFHGEFKDGSFESYYEYDRKPDGSRPVMPSSA